MEEVTEGAGTAGWGGCSGCGGAGGGLGGERWGGGLKAGDVLGRREAGRLQRVIIHPVIGCLITAAVILYEASSTHA